MKKILLMLPLLLLISGGIAYLGFAPTNLEKETFSVVVDSVTAVSESWDGKVLRERADPGLIKAMSSQGQSPEELLRIYSALGRLKHTPECKVKVTGSFMKAGERHTTISYECSAEYEKGPAVISITLSKGESEKAWLIYYINIHSDVFGEVIE